MPDNLTMDNVTTLAQNAQSYWVSGWLLFGLFLIAAWAAVTVTLALKVHAATTRSARSARAVREAIFFLSIWTIA